MMFVQFMTSRWMALIGIGMLVHTLTSEAFGEVYLLKDADKDAHYSVVMPCVQASEDLPRFTIAHTCHEPLLHNGESVEVVIPYHTGLAPAAGALALTHVGVHSVSSQPLKSFWHRLLRTSYPGKRLLLTLAGIGTVVGYVYKRSVPLGSGMWLSSATDKVNEEMQSLSSQAAVDGEIPSYGSYGKEPKMVPFLSLPTHNSDREQKSGYELALQKTEDASFSSIPAVIYFGKLESMLQEYSEHLLQMAQVLAAKNTAPSFIKEFNKHFWHEVFFVGELGEYVHKLSPPDHHFYSLGFRLVHLHHNIHSRVLPYVSSYYEYKGEYSESLALEKQLQVLAELSLSLGHTLTSLQDRLMAFEVDHTVTRKMLSKFVYTPLAFGKVFSSNRTKDLLEEYYILDFAKLASMFSVLAGGASALQEHFEGFVLANTEQDSQMSTNEDNGVVADVQASGVQEWNIPLQRFHEQLLPYESVEGRLTLAVAIALEMLKPIKEVIEGSAAQVDGVVDEEILMWDGSQVSQELLHSHAFDGLVHALTQHPHFDVKEVLDGFVYKDHLGMIYDTTFSASLLRSYAALQVLAAKLDLRQDHMATIVAMWTRGISSYAKLEYIQDRAPEITDPKVADVWRVATDILQVSAMLDYHYELSALNSAREQDLQKYGTSYYERFRASEYLVTSISCELCGGTAGGFAERYAAQGLLFADLSEKYYHHKSEEAHKNSGQQKDKVLAVLENAKQRDTLDGEFGSLYVAKEYQLLLKNYAFLEYLEKQIFYLIEENPLQVGNLGIMQGKIEVDASMDEAAGDLFEGEIEP